MALRLSFRALDIDTVNAIAAWIYPDTGTGLFMTPYQESYLETPANLKGPGGCDGYGVHRDEELFGLFEYTFAAGEMEIGCAIAPEFKGKGFGAEFVQAGIAFGVSKYRYTGERILLEVDAANLAALRAYEKAGFSIHNQSEETIRMFKRL